MLTKEEYKIKKNNGVLEVEVTLAEYLLAYTKPELFRRVNKDQIKILLQDEGYNPGSHLGDIYEIRNDRANKLNHGVFIFEDKEASLKEAVKVVATSTPPPKKSKPSKKNTLKAKEE